MVHVPGAITSNARPFSILIDTRSTMIAGRDHIRCRGCRSPRQTPSVLAHTHVPGMRSTSSMTTWPCELTAGDAYTGAVSSWPHGTTQGCAGLLRQSEQDPPGPGTTGWIMLVRKKHAPGGSRQLHTFSSARPFEHCATRSSSRRTLST